MNVTATGASSGTKGEFLIRKQGCFWKIGTSPGLYGGPESERMKPSETRHPSSQTLRVGAAPLCSLLSSSSRGIATLHCESHFQIPRSIWAQFGQESTPELISYGRGRGGGKGSVSEEEGRPRGKRSLWGRQIFQVCLPQLFMFYM